MADAASLRKLLKNTDVSAPAIQNAAGAMMKHYDKSPGVAVVEWRNALHQAQPDQYLPLLYVANEVLQNSKRNRGNKFLEEFSPTLGQSLIFISQRSPASVVEKIRRTVKIWADRHVFSVRFVNDLLKGLEPYRNGGSGGAAPPVPAGGGSPVSSLPESSPAKITPKEQSKENFDRSMGLGGDSDNVVVGGLSTGGDDDDDDEIEDLFGNASNKLLKIDVDLDQAAAASSLANAGTAGKKKRRRSPEIGGAKAGGQSAGVQKSKRRTILSTNSLMELWNQVSSLQMRYDRVQGKLKEINNPEYLDEDSVNQQIDTLVGDELLQEYKKTIQHESDIAKHRKELHDIAQQRKILELEAIRYLPWLENALKQDEDDIKFCEKYGEQLRLFQHVHKPARHARDKRLREEERRRKEQEELRKKEEEEEDRKKFMESAMAKQTEAKPGMVWNKAAGEYQYLNQDESWRD